MSYTTNYSTTINGSTLELSNLFANQSTPISNPEFNTSYSTIISEINYDLSKLFIIDNDYQNNLPPFYTNYKSNISSVEYDLSELFIIDLIPTNGSTILFTDSGSNVGTLTYDWPNYQVSYSATSASYSVYGPAYGFYAFDHSNSLGWGSPYYGNTYPDVGEYFQSTVPGATRPNPQTPQPLPPGQNYYGYYAPDQCASSELTFPTYTTYYNGGSENAQGEWLQIQFSKPVKLQSYQLISQGGGRSPNGFVILGTNTNPPIEYPNSGYTSWDYIDNQFVKGGTDLFALSSTVNFTPNPEPSNSYLYYRMVVYNIYYDTVGGGSGIFTLTNWNLFGRYTKLTFTTTGMVTIDKTITTNTLYTLTFTTSGSITFQGLPTSSLSYTVVAGGNGGHAGSNSNGGHGGSGGQVLNGSLNVSLQMYNINVGLGGAAGKNSSPPGVGENSEFYGNTATGGAGAPGGVGGNRGQNGTNGTQSAINNNYYGGGGGGGAEYTAVGYTSGKGGRGGGGEGGGYGQTSSHSSGYNGTVNTGGGGGGGTASGYGGLGGSGVVILQFTY